MSSDLVPVVEGQPQLPAHMAHVVGDTDLLMQARVRVVSSLSKDDHRQSEMLLRAMQDSDASGRETINTEIDVAHFVLRTASRRSLGTGELEPCMILSLVSPDGSVWSTTSDWCIQSFHLLSAFRGYPPWNPARVLKVVGVKTKGGFYTYRLSESVRTLPPPKPSSKS